MRRTSIRWRQKTGKVQGVAGGGGEDLGAAGVNGLGVGVAPIGYWLGRLQICGPFSGSCFLRFPPPPNRAISIPNDWQGHTGDNFHRNLRV